MKRSVCVLLAALMVTLSAQGTLAAQRPSAPAWADIEIRPYWEAVASVVHGVSISGRTAYVTASVSAYNSSTKLTVTATLQKASGTSWIDQKSWSGSGSGDCDVDGSISVSSGTYRVKTTVVAKDSAGNTLDSFTSYSSTKTV